MDVIMSIFTYVRHHSLRSMFISSNNFNRADAAFAKYLKDLVSALGIERILMPDAVRGLVCEGVLHFSCFLVSGLIFSGSVGIA